MPSSPSTQSLPSRTWGRLLANSKEDVIMHQRKEIEVLRRKNAELEAKAKSTNMVRFLFHFFSFFFSPSHSSD